MQMGPLEFMVIAFEGNRFNGDIMPELHSLRERDVIRIRDLVFIRKDAGAVTTLELSDLPREEASSMKFMDTESGDWFAQDDIEQVGDSLPDETSVALVLVEHIWALPLQQAVKKAHGAVLAGGPVAREALDQVEEMMRTRA